MGKVRWLGLERAKVLVQWWYVIAGHDKAIIYRWWFGGIFHNFTPFSDEDTTSQKEKNTVCECLANFLYSFWTLPFIVLYIFCEYTFSYHSTVASFCDVCSYIELIPLAIYNTVYCCVISVHYIASNDPAPVTTPFPHTSINYCINCVNKSGLECVVYSRVRELCHTPSHRYISDSGTYIALPPATVVKRGGVGEGGEPWRQMVLHTKSYWRQMVLHIREYCAFLSQCYGEREGGCVLVLIIRFEFTAADIDFGSPTIKYGTVP